MILNRDNIQEHLVSFVRDNVRRQRVKLSDGTIFLASLVFMPLGENYDNRVASVIIRRAIFLKKDAKGFFSIHVYPILCGDATREISRQIPKRSLVIRSSITSCPRNNRLAGVSIAF